MFNEIMKKYMANVVWLLPYSSKNALGYYSLGKNVHNNSQV